MQKTDYLRLHKIYDQIADYYDIELERTDYESHVTYSDSKNKQKSDHKEAIRLISCLLEEETELPVTRLESWKENTLKYDTSNWENPVGK